MGNFTYLKIKEELNEFEKGRLCICECLLCGNQNFKTRISRVKALEQLSCGCYSHYKPRRDVTGQEINGILFVGFMLNGEWRVKYKCNHIGVNTPSRADKSKTGLCLECSAKLPTTLKHGNARREGTSSTYNSWNAMRRRCSDPSNNRYKQYGAKGIKVEKEEWNTSFEVFLNDMGECPIGYSLERLDLSKGYSPENCIWADDIIQANNKSNNILISNMKGEIWSLRRWCDKLNIEYKDAWYRHKKMGKPLLEILGEGYFLVEKEKRDSLLANII